MKKGELLLRSASKHDWARSGLKFNIAPRCIDINLHILPQNKGHMYGSLFDMLHHIFLMLSYIFSRPLYILSELGAKFSLLHISPALGHEK